MRVRLELDLDEILEIFEALCAGPQELVNKDLWLKVHAAKKRLEEHPATGRRPRRTK